MITKTKFEKYIIFQTPSLMFKSVKTTSIIMFFKMLKNQQHKKLCDFANCILFVLNENINNDENLKQIFENDFTHSKLSKHKKNITNWNKSVFIRSKIAILKTFNEKMLRHVNFTDRLCLLAFDEIHLVSKWRNFKLKYCNLNVFRTRLFDDISFLKASAIFVVKILKMMQNKCDLHYKTMILQTLLNRSKIYLRISQLQHLMKSMFDFQFLLFINVKKIVNIFKTIVLMNFIKFIKMICQLIKNWIKQLNYSTYFDTWILSFFLTWQQTIKTKSKLNSKLNQINVLTFKYWSRRVRKNWKLTIKTLNTLFNN